jgi:DNA processing protein
VNGGAPRQGRLDLAGGRRIGVALSDRQRRDWLRLSRTEGVGPRTFRALVNRFGGASAALAALPEVTRERLGRSIRAIEEPAVDAELAAAARMGARFVALGEPDYPHALAEIADPPPVLALLGRVDLAREAAVAIVGSRNASASGLRMAERLAEALAGEGFPVVSGLARGIDAAAHRAALSGGTVAVLAGGLDKLYPPENAGLFDLIAAEGLLVSEMPFGWQPRGRDFPRRNRLVSGLALGVVVVEAAKQSGSLITARMALEQGREVFAVPGSPLDPRAEGPNHLIRQGATLVTSAADVSAVLRPMRGRQLPAQVEEETGEPPRHRLWDELNLFGEGEAPLADIDEDRAFAEERIAGPAAPVDLRARVLELLSPSPCSPDDLAAAAPAAIRDIHALLLALEMEGRLERLPGGLVTRAT